MDSGSKRRDRGRRANSPSISNVSSSPSRNPRQRPRQAQRDRDRDNREEESSPLEPVQRQRSARRLVFSDESTAPGEEDPEEESDGDAESQDDQRDRDRRRTPARRRTSPDRRAPAPQPRQRQRQKSGGGSSTGTVDNNNEVAFVRQQSRGGGGGRPSSSDTIDLPRQLDRLQRDLARREQELQEERNENERALNRIRKLERDKSEVEQELEEVRDELNEYVIKYDELRQAAGTPSSAGKKKLQFQATGSSDEQAANEIVEAKNREIATLLEDVEKLEGEKQALHGKLADLRDSLHDATAQIESMSQESAEFKEMMEKQDDKIKKLEDEKTVLEIKERDLLIFKERHEKYLENLCAAVDVRVDVWKRMMVEKDEEIDRLNVKISALLAQIPNTQIDNEKSVIRQLKKRILDREEQINLLNQQLHQATVDIEAHTKTIQEFQSKLNYSENNDQTQKFVHGLESKLKKYTAALQQKSQVVHTYEKEIEERSREVTQLLSRLHDYETGQYGLVDAIAEIKGVKGQLHVRDKQIEELTQDVNQLQLQRQDVLDENELLRSKLGLTATEQKSLRQETEQFVHGRLAEIERTKNRVRVLENEVVELKSKNYRLRKEINAAREERYEKEQRASSLSPSPPPQHRRKSKDAAVTRPRSSGSGRLSRRSEYTMTTPTIVDAANEDSLNANLPAPEWKEKYEMILDENTELRKGLVEILDSMRRLSDETTSNILIESPILENLLREMSARGLLNYPHSVSGFHLKVCNLEGKNSELRDEIHRLRCEEKQLRIELIEAKVQMQYAQEKLKGHDTTDYSRSRKPSRSRSCDSGPSRVEEKLVVADNDESGNITTALDLAHTPQSEIATNVQAEIEALSDVYEAHVQINQLKTQVNQLETLLNAKDQVLNEFKILHIEPYKPSDTGSGISASPRSNAELIDVLQVAQDSILNLQERLKVKEDNIASCRKLLAEVRGELTASADRHVQEMKALQETIYQQQQAYTRMKSTLSHPVRDTMNIEGALRDQLTRINELEDEISELQHTLGNVASQLTSARSEANKWKALADEKSKELDGAKESLSEETLEELKLLREKLRTHEELLREFRIAGPSADGSGTGSKSVRFEEIRQESELVQMLRGQLAEKGRRLNTYSNTIQNFKKGKSSDKSTDDSKEVQELKERHCQLQQKITALTLKVSKLKASNQSTGISAELEDLRSRFKTLLEEKFNLQKRFDDLQMKGHDDEEKRRKQIDSLARWDESKKWKKIVEKFESRIQELETENDKLLKTNQTLRLIVARLEKEKHLVDSKLLHHTRNVTKLSKSRDSMLGLDESTVGTDSEQPQTMVADPTARIDQLKLESHELKELLQKNELESRQTEEKLRMEIRVLKERITSQERQITAYQVASKGDPKIIAEIEKMVHNEESLQKQLLKLEEENLHLNLQMEQLRMDTPRLRDRVQHLQKLVDVLKVEKPTVASTSRTNVTMFSPTKTVTNQKSLSELERTIAALKNVIDKLQTENKKLKRPTSLTLRKSGSAAGSSEKLKASIAGLLDEKQLLLDQLHELEREKQKDHQMYLDATSNIDHLQINLMDSEKKAKSAEMKLRSFLSQKSGETDAVEGAAVGTAGPSGNEKMFQYMREMQEKLDRKDKLLSEAKEALKEAAAASTLPGTAGRKS